MAMNGKLSSSDESTDPVLTRAAQELRDEETPSWIDASTAILATLRATARRTRALDAVFPEPGLDGDSLRVGDHLVLLAVSAAMSDLPSSIRSADLRVEGRTCLGVDLDVAVPYGDGIVSLAEDMTVRAADAVNTTLGTRLGPDDVGIHIVDVLPPL